LKTLPDSIALFLYPASQETENERRNLADDNKVSRHQEKAKVVRCYRSDRSIHNVHEFGRHQEIKKTSERQGHNHQYDCCDDLKLVLDVKLRMVSLTVVNKGDPN
jgi:hypothetical protein